MHAVYANTWLLLLVVVHSTSENKIDSSNCFVSTVAARFGFAETTNYKQRYLRIDQCEKADPAAAMPMSLFAQRPRITIIVVNCQRNNNRFAIHSVQDADGEFNQHKVQE